MDNATSPSSPVHVLRLRDVLQRTALGRTYLLDLVGRGEFPKPIELGPRARGWLANEVEGWISSRPRSK